MQLAQDGHGIHGMASMYVVMVWNPPARLGCGTEYFRSWLPVVESFAAAKLYGVGTCIHGVRRGHTPYGVLAG